MDIGDTFFPITDVMLPHLWVIITSPRVDGHMVMVNVTSHRTGVDETCFVRVGDHPFIRHLSVISYQHAQHALAAGLDALVQREYLQARPPMPAAIVARIQHGALASRLTPRGVQAAVRRELGLGR